MAEGRKTPGWSSKRFLTYGSLACTRRNRWLKRLRFAQPGILAILAALVLTPPAVRAQVLYGTLTGTVTDSTGAVIPGAQVTALEAQTGVSQTATSDAAGIYRFPTLLPGIYKVTIAAQGFATQETAGVLVTANEIARVNASLKVGSATQSVTVTTAAPILQTDKADVHTDFSAHQIENLPIMGSRVEIFRSCCALSRARV
jgi:Carboxypeptidase regulatory-like domain